ncbi:hypothetical protein RCC89_07565 [Cytophagaceae bacterium ABcell3]|nr:hypothetical protein RCC89_07565 [Cytophagaceae bacterium ABcell3]
MEILFALVISLLFSVVFLTLFKVKGTIGTFWVFMLVIFLVTMVSIRLVRPAGVPIVGVYWIPGLVAALLTSLLLVAIAKATGHAGEKLPKDEGRSKAYNKADTSEASIGLVFWLFLIFLLIASLVGIFR